MTAWAAVAAALLLGWGIWRRASPLDPGTGAVTGAVLFGALGTGAWLAVLDLLGAPWSMPLLLMPAAVSAVAGATARQPLRRVAADERPWLAGALLAVLPRAVVTALNPAFGWDFRYFLGLKARVFAVASGHDGAWLAWPGHAFANPDYPPLWSDLLAAGVRLDAPVDAVAAAWQSVLVVALAAACWEAAEGAPPRVRALAAAAGGWCPVLFWPRYSGYSEPLLAFFAAVAFGRLCQHRGDSLDGAWTLAAATAALALTKNEGVALAAGVVLGVAWSRGLRRVLLPALALAIALGAWKGFLLAARIETGWAFAGLGRLADHLVELPRAVAGAFKPKYAVVAIAWILALPGLRGRRCRGAQLALGVWAVAVFVAYAATPFDLTWHLFTSLDRVLAAPLPAAIALALGSSLSRPPRVVERSSPAPSRGGSPSA